MNEEVDSEDLKSKRAMLTSLRLQYSPEAQPVKDSAIDRIVAQAFLLFDDFVSGEEVYVSNALAHDGNIQVISKRDFQQSCIRLVAAKKLSQRGNEHVFKIEQEERTKLWAQRKAAEDRFGRVTSRLFKGIENINEYEKAFLECLCGVFSLLGDVYIRQIKGNGHKKSPMQAIAIKLAVQDVSKKYSFDRALFADKIIQFFQENDPDSDQIKWHLSQNYYIVKALGVDPSGKILSKEMFGGATILIDTNIVIPALEPIENNHESFKAIASACHNLGIELSVCQITINELRNLVSHHQKLITAVRDKIPNETKPKIRSTFFQIYERELLKTPTVKLEDVFDKFVNCRDPLDRDYGVSLFDSGWFDKAVENREVIELADRLKVHYQRVKPRGKSNAAALHDALLLLWIQERRTKDKKNAWLLTMDTTLPTFSMEKSEDKRSFAIGLDALLQWMSPVSSDDSEDNIARVYAQAVRQMVLPDEVIFDLNDFRIFAELEWESKNLPARDVEDCIRHIKSIAPELDPSNPADRERLAHVVGKFIADPGREHKERVEWYENELGRSFDEIEKTREKARNAEELAQKLQQELVSKESTIAVLDNTKSEELRLAHNQLEKKDEIIATNASSIDELKKEINALKGDLEAEKLQRKVVDRRSRFVTWTAISLVMLIITIYLIFTSGEGANWFQKLAGAWEIFACVVGVVLSGYAYIIKNT